MNSFGRRTDFWSQWNEDDLTPMEPTDCYLCWSLSLETLCGVDPTVHWPLWYQASKMLEQKLNSNCVPLCVLVTLYVSICVYTLYIVCVCIHLYSNAHVRMNHLVHLPLWLLSLFLSASHSVSLSDFLTIFMFPLLPDIKQLTENCRFPAELLFFLKNWVGIWKGLLHMTESRAHFSIAPSSELGWFGYLHRELSSVIQTNIITFEIQGVCWSKFKRTLLFSWR